MNTAKQFTQLMEIAERALEADNLEMEAKFAKGDLSEAYVSYKTDRKLDDIKRGSDEWDGMLLATKSEYEVSSKAKRQAYNAKRRLQSSIIRYRAGA